MTEVNLFETASRERYRFPSHIGDLTAEQLWTLPLVTTKANAADLNGIAVAISKTLKETTEESFVSPVPNKINKTLSNKLEIVKHIIAVRQAEAEAVKAAKAKADEKAILLEALARKRDDKVNAMSEEEILKRINEL